MDNAIMQRLLLDAGVGAGMRVLDVGCGWGAVSFLLASLVGPEGQVVGVDRDASALAVARARALELELGAVRFNPNPAASRPAHSVGSPSGRSDLDLRFVEADLSALPREGALLLEHGPFDAIVGRRVLMYQRDPVEVIRQLTRVLRPGGLVVFQEQDATMVPASVTPLPLHERAHGWMWRTVEREGGNTHMGFDLASVLERAGLSLVQVRAEAIVQTPTMPPTAGTIIRAIMHRIVQQGVATEAEIDVDTLDERLAAERKAANATYVGDMVFGAWARAPE
jgi:ubiquinone/menaquinone biosynthesis C-methylase UbiE